MKAACTKSHRSKPALEWCGPDRGPQRKEAAWTERPEEAGETSTAIEFLVAPPDHPLRAVVDVEQNRIPRPAAIEQACHVADVEPYAWVEERVTCEMSEPLPVPSDHGREKLRDDYPRVSRNSVEERTQREAQSQASNQNPWPRHAAKEAGGRRSEGTLRTSFTAGHEHVSARRDDVVIAAPIERHRAVRRICSRDYPITGERPRARVHPTTIELRRRLRRSHVRATEIGRRSVCRRKAARVRGARSACHTFSLPRLEQQSRVTGIYPWLA
jgi:hypothetical protein